MDSGTFAEMVRQMNLQTVARKRCPQCGAERGQLCQRKGQPLATVHRARIG